MTDLSRDLEIYLASYIKNDDRDDTEDTFFLLSKDELEGKYEFIKTERNRVKVNKRGETEDYWARSANRTYSYRTCLVSNTGYVGSGTASWVRGVSPACVISA